MHETKLMYKNKLSLTLHYYQFLILFFFCIIGSMTHTDLCYVAALSLQVVVTIPLAVLKAGVVSFSPPLTARKVEAIERLGAGLVEKVCVQAWGCVSSRSSVVLWPFYIII